MTGVLSVYAGIYSAGKAKFGTAGKIAAGILCGGFILGGAQYFDKTIDTLSQKNNLKRMQVEEITDNEEKVNEALNYSAEKTEDAK